MLKEISEDTLESFVVWVYTGKLYLEMDDPPFLMNLHQPVGDDDDDEYSDNASSDTAASIDAIGLISEGEAKDLLKAYRIVTSEDVGKLKESDVVRSVLGVDDQDSIILDAYQLGILLEMTTGIKFVAFHSKWRALLEQKQSVGAVGEQNEFDTRSHFADTYDRLINLYILADRLDVRDLRNQIMIILHSEIQDPQNYSTLQVPSLASFAKAWKCLPKHSKLLEWLLDVQVYKWSPRCQHWLLREEDEIRAMMTARRDVSADFWMALLHEMQSSMLVGTMKGTWDDWLYGVDQCKTYHEHASQQEVKACQKAQSAFAAEADDGDKDS